MRARKSRPTARPRLWLKATPPPRRKTSPQSVLTNQLSARNAAAAPLRRKTSATNYRKDKKKAMAAEEPDDRWTITFRALSAFGPGAVCALLEDAKFDQEALKRRAPRQLCSRGDTLLTRAARLGNMAAAKQLLRLGADLEWPTGETDLSPLQVACHCGHDKLVTFFLKQGASIQRRNNRGLSAVSTAVHTPNVKCLDVLAKHDLGVPRCCGAFTPSTRLVSIRRGRGWFIFRF